MSMQNYFDCNDLVSNTLDNLVWCQFILILSGVMVGKSRFEFLKRVFTYHFLATPSSLSALSLNSDWSLKIIHVLLLRGMMFTLVGFCYFVRNLLLLKASVGHILDMS